LASALAEPAPRWADLRKRAVSAVVLAPLALVVIWVGGAPFWIVVGVVGCGLIWEWWRLMRGRGWLFAGGLIWILVALAALLALRSDPVAGRANVIFLFVLVWASDIGAYGVGRLIGGPRLAPTLSPGKTWAGAAGGLFAATAIGLLAASTGPRSNPLTASGIAAFLALVGQAGDLAESAIKRSAGVKDSGYLIPGHGGLLDRLDATIAVLPAGALLALLLGRGVVLWQ
jgi:phosphatidate cytidylyltransferase